MVDKISTLFVITSLDKGDIPASLQNHQDTINNLPPFSCSCGVHHAWVIEGTGKTFLVSQFVHWIPQPE